MDPNIWGPKFWFSLHSVSFTYPFSPDTKDKERYKTFFGLLEHLLPCVLCRNNYSKNIQNYPIDGHLDSRKSLAYWVMDIHNMVNSEIGKKFMSYDVVLKKYENVYQKDLLVGKNMDYDNKDLNVNGINNKTKYNLEYILLLILIIIFIIFIIRIPKNSLKYP